MELGSGTVEDVVSKPLCRSCESPLEVTFADLGMSPLANAYIEPAHAGRSETFYPLHAWVCGTCFLVQLEEFASREEIFSNYAYFSSYSESWIAHARTFAEDAVRRFSLDVDSFVVEAASNDGYLLKEFQRLGVRVLGVEPAVNVARAATDDGVPTVAEFLGRDSGDSIATEYGAADLVIANNVIAHVPNLHNFIAGLKALCKPTGTISIEFPHLLELMRGGQFDTIYHEHFSYFSLHSLEWALSQHGLVIVDCARLATHGGSLRLLVMHAEAGRVHSDHVSVVRSTEERDGLRSLHAYSAFSERAVASKHLFWKFLSQILMDGKTIAAYGAPAKGNTFLNYCGIKAGDLPFTVDRNPEKAGKLLPGSRIPILNVDMLEQRRPDYLLILPWNLRDEIVQQTARLKQLGTKYVTAIPRLAIE